MSFLLCNIVAASVSMDQILNVFKHIGWIALIVLLVVIIVGICVLFVPIRYRAQGNIDEMDFSLRFYWFLRIVSFRCWYKDGTGDYALYLFGLRTKLLDKDFLDKWSKRREKRKAKKAAKAYKSRRKKYKKQHEKYKEQYLKEQGADFTDDSVVNDADTQTNIDSTKNESNNQSEQKSVNKIITFLKKGLHILQVIRDYQPLQMIWNDLLKFFYHIRPRKINADICFGFDEPATTGHLLGLISNVFFIYRYDNLKIHGDFETQESYIKGQFDMKGFIQMFFGLVFIIRVIKKKRFRKFLKALKL